MFTRARKFSIQRTGNERENQVAHFSHVREDGERGGNGKETEMRRNMKEPLKVSDPPVAQSQPWEVLLSIMVYTFKVQQPLTNASGFIFQVI